jgi:hypothetical protein
VNDEVDLAPQLFDVVEDSIDGRLVADIAMSSKNAVYFCNQGLNALLQRIALVGKCDFAALRMNSLGNAPRNRTIVGNAHDDAALA